MANDRVAAALVLRVTAKKLMKGENRMKPVNVRKQTGVPRRFGVGAAMVIMTMYALLFAALQRTPAIIFVAVSAFFTVVGVAQAVLYKGRNPRLASVVAGMVACPVIAIIATIVAAPRGSNQAVAIAGELLCTLFGGGFGYLAGGLIAGVFLFLNKVQPPLEDEEPEGEKTPGEPEE